MSRPDHTPRLAVDFAAPSRRSQRGRRLLVLITVVALTAALLVAVTQLLLR